MIIRLLNTHIPRVPLTRRHSSTLSSSPIAAIWYNFCNPHPSLSLLTALQVPSASSHEIQKKTPNFFIFLLIHQTHPDIRKVKFKPVNQQKSCLFRIVCRGTWQISIERYLFPSLLISRKLFHVAGTYVVLSKSMLMGDSYQSILPLFSLSRKRECQRCLSLLALDSFTSSWFSSTMEDKSSPIWWDSFSQVISPYILTRRRYWWQAYESIRAIESAGTADDTQWLTYWVVFGFFNLIEYWSRTILYWLRKCPFHPQLSTPWCWCVCDSFLLPLQNYYCPLACSSSVPWSGIRLSRLPPSSFGKTHRSSSRSSRYYPQTIDLCWCRISRASSQQLDTCNGSGNGRTIVSRMWKEGL